MKQGDTAVVTVDFALMPREAKSEQVHIFVNGELVEKCALIDQAARLAAYGYRATRYGGYQGGAGALWAKGR